MSSLGGPPPLPKLPIWDVVGLAYSGYFRNFADVLRVSWLWLLLAAVATGVVSWEQWRVIGVAVLNSAQHTQLPPDFAAAMFARMAPAIAAANLVLILAFVSVAVAWHRRIILDERPSLLNFNVATRSFWRYIGVGLAIAVLALLPLALVLIPIAAVLAIAGNGVQPSMMVMAAHPGLAAIAIPLGLAAYVIAFVIVLRLSMLLPARAAGNIDLSFARSWGRTRGNCWRIFWGVMICTAVPVIVAEMVLLPAGAPNPAGLVAAGPDAIPALVGDFAVRLTVISMALTAFFMLTLPIGIGFLSLAYRHFFGEAISPAP